MRTRANVACVGAPVAVRSSAVGSSPQGCTSSSKTERLRSSAGLAMPLQTSAHEPHSRSVGAEFGDSSLGAAAWLSQQAGSALTGSSCVQQATKAPARHNAGATTNVQTAAMSISRGITKECSPRDGGVKGGRFRDFTVRDSLTPKCGFPHACVLPIRSDRSRLAKLGSHVWVRSAREWLPTSPRRLDATPVSGFCKPRSKSSDANSAEIASYLAPPTDCD